MPKNDEIVTQQTTLEEEIPLHNPLVVTGDMEQQLRSMYAERQQLVRALGTADAEAIIRMVRSMEAQLTDLYAQKTYELDPADQ